ncbi:hypothetical protein Hypma_015979 [Hypsizygus marmoreus]|uniref:Uncharacterized protein n=1 Tax=Hypsizygus marmoreus TaxID=39966 RepID=A0A369K7T0_HYPMA|nr:hypothetical protein Hypma_015979 [Hypsizygus marmoreus]
MKTPNVSQFRRRPCLEAELSQKRFFGSFPQVYSLRALSQSLPLLLSPPAPALLVSLRRLISFQLPPQHIVLVVPYDRLIFASFIQSSLPSLVVPPPRFRPGFFTSVRNGF